MIVYIAKGAAYDWDNDPLASGFGKLPQGINIVNGKKLLKK